MIIEAVVEIPRGSRCKYEYNQKRNILTLERILKDPIPYNYGYIPHTLHGDGDPLDVYVIVDESIASMTQVKIEIVGALICTDNGQADDKLLTVVAGDTRFPPGFGSRLIQSYLTGYKPGFVVERLVSKEEAVEIYNKCNKAWSEKFIADLKATADRLGFKTNE